MPETTDSGLIDGDSFISLDEASLRTELPRYKLVKQFRNLWLDCRPLEKSYLWLGRGIVDRRFAPMPGLGLLIEESHQIISSRLRLIQLVEASRSCQVWKSMRGENSGISEAQSWAYFQYPCPRLVIANSTFRANFTLRPKQFLSSSLVK